MKRPYRCNHYKCKAAKKNRLVHLDPNEVPNLTCPDCGTNCYTRLTLIHMLHEIENPDPKEINSQGRAYRYGCSYAKQEADKVRNGTRVGNPIIASFAPKEITCYECLKNMDFEFDMDTRQFTIVESKQLLGD